MRFRPAQPSPTLVVSVIGRIIALRGHASSVGNKQRRNGAVTAERIARNVVTSASVKRNSLTGADTADSTNNANLAGGAGL